VSLPCPLFEVDPALVGRRVELLFDPFDLTRLQVRYAGRPMGEAVPHRIGRHTHPKARPEAAPPPAPTGIDYLRLVEARHDAQCAERVRYAELADAPDSDLGARPRSVSEPHDLTIDHPSVDTARHEETQ
jgi:putative transposase